MEFNIKKEALYNNLRAVERVTAVRGVQPVLSNVLIETIDDNIIRLAATDLDLSIEVKVQAEIKTQGSITLPAKKLIEIISKLPDKNINFKLESESTLTIITCGNSKFDLIGISSSEFNDVFNKEMVNTKEFVNIELAPLLKAIKQTIFSSASYDSNNILSGVYCKIYGKELEMAATDGNRLSRIVEKITNKEDKDYSIVIPSKTLNELTRLVVGIEDENVSIAVQSGQILFKLKDRILLSRLLEGQYPKYQQLIPKTCEKNAIVDREALIGALDRTSTMVNERTSIIKFTFSGNKLLLKADTPDYGDSMDLIDVDYTSEELIIAFNYKYLLDALRIMDSEKTVIELGGSLSATILKPDNEDNYLYLVMPVQIR